MLLPRTELREPFLEALAKRGILGVFHYLPLHISDMGQRFGGKPGDCPVAEDIAQRLVRLPFFNSLTQSEQGEVIEAVTSFRA
jgi:dTDP-4-amino-4,6-dideoxygalactose transaminase